MKEADCPHTVLSLYVAIVCSYITCSTFAYPLNFFEALVQLYHSGVRTRILELNERALYVHCYSHKLNLVLNLLEISLETFKHCKCLFLDVANDRPISI